MSEPHLDEFATAHFGKRIARTDDDLDVEAWARDHDVDCVQALIDASRTETINDAEARGYRLMDIRVTLGRDTNRSQTTAIRPAEPDDLERLRGIARTSHRITRYYADPRLPDARCDELYDAWITNSVNGYAQAVLVTGTLGVPRGYVTVHLERDTASIGLIAVAERLRREGLGVALTLAAVDWAWRHDAKRITVVTQGRNIAALRTFERAAFRVAQTQVWFSKWMDEE